MTGSTYVGFVTSFIGSVFATRAMGPDDYGVYAYLVWMVTFVTGVVTGFLNITTVRFVAEALGADRLALVHSLVSWLKRIFWRMLAASLVVLALSSLVPGLYPAAVTSHLLPYLGFVALCVLLRATFSFQMGVAKGHSVFYPEAISSSLTGLLSAAAGAVLLGLGAGLPAFLTLFLLASAFLLVVSLRVMDRHALHHPAGEPMDDTERSRVGQVLKWNAVISLVGMLSTKSADTYLLGLYATTAYVGYYNIAWTITKAGLDLLSSGYSSMLLPMISRAGGEGDPSKVQRIFTMSFKFYQTVGIVVAAGAWIIVGPVVHLLYGERYAEVIPAVQVMTMTTGITLPGAAYSAAFIATDSQRARVAFIVTSALVSALSSVAFIPWLGYEGALYSVFVGGVLNFAITAVVAHRLLGFAYPWRSVLLQWLCAVLPLGLMSWVLPVGHSLPLAVVSCLVFGVVFLVLGLNLRAWGDDEIATLRQASPKLDRLIGRLMWRGR